MNILTSRTNTSFVGTGSNVRGSSVTLLNRNGLNKSQNGLDISKSSSVSGLQRSVGRFRGNSQDVMSNHSAGGTRRKNSKPKKVGA